MHVFVLDPGFVGEGGHHLAMNRFIAEWLQDRGHEVTVLASQRYNPSKKWGFRIVKPFEISPYTGRNDVRTNMMLYIHSNRQTEDFLTKGLVSDRIPKGSVILIHTGFDIHLEGIARWLVQLNRPDLKLRILLRFPPTMPYTDYDMAKSLSRHTLQQWENVPGDLRFFTDLDELSAYFMDYSDFNFQTTPIALHFDQMPAAQRIEKPDQRGLHFIYAGGFYPAKGSHLLADAIKRHSAIHPEDRYTIHAAAVANPDDIEHLKAASSNVNILTTLLHGEDFFNYLLSGDVTFICYDPVEYYLRTSHIMFESLGLGRMVIASKDSWMENQMRQIGLPVGALMPTYDSEGLAIAMGDCKANALRYADNAYFMSAYIRRRHNADEWMRCMFQDTGILENE